VTLNVSGEGTVTLPDGIDADSVPYYTSLALGFNPATGHSLSSVTVNGEIVESTEPITIYGDTEINVAYTSGTSIDTVVLQDKSKDDIFYDLSGRRVQQPKRGLYINGNGRKVLIR